MQLLEDESLDLSIIMPCRDEEQTVGICIDEVNQFFDSMQIRGEVLVIDNASTDASAIIAAKHGARVLVEKRIGYGNAIQTGIKNSKGSVLIIGDCDTTYDFKNLEEMYRLLVQKNCDMVIGNRYAGGMEPGSMSWIHWWGVRFLSFCARWRFRTDIYDFHCGLRGISRKAVEQLTFQTQGMEFATEMIAEGVKKKLCLGQVPVVLRRCKYKRVSKLRTIRDGLRHFCYIIRRN